MKNMPGFTAEVSLYKPSGYYQMITLLNQANATIYPAQLLVTNTQSFWPGLLHWPIVEPTCIRLCLPGGGYCRWICF
jgi:hypothetical protein